MPRSPASLLRRLVGPLVCLLAATLAPTPAAGQPCEPEWLPGEGIPGLGSTMRAAVMWDPDGPSPAAEQLVLGGYFTTAGNITANRIVTWDPATGAWTTLGTGMADGHVYALAVLPDGDLVAAGTFSAAGDVEVDNIARWDGTAWHPLGAGVGPARAMLVLPGGDIIVGGDRYVARWDGSSWNHLGSGMDDKVISLAALPNGDIVAGGEFEQAGGVWAARIARWDGTQWNPMSSGSRAPVLPLFVTSGGELIAGGRFEGALQRTLSRWDGSNWIRITTGYGVGRLLELPGGDWIAGGFFTALGGGVSVRNIARWDGENWHPLGAGVTGGHEDSVSALALLPSGELFAGGGFQTAGGEPAFNAAVWDGEAWRPLSRGMNGAVLAALQLPTGDVVIGGDFTYAPDGVKANRIAQWDGADWRQLGDGFDQRVLALGRLSNGDIIAGGAFSAAGTVPLNRVARWDGHQWKPLGEGIDGTVDAIAVLPNDDVIVGGKFSAAGGKPAEHVARWNGDGWDALAGGVTATVRPPYVHSLLALAEGGFLVGGTFTSAGGVPSACIARWDGEAWHALGEGIWHYWATPAVHAIAQLPSGEIIAGGWFEHAGTGGARHIALWDGADWRSIGDLGGGVHALWTSPEGDVFAGGTIDAGVARWDGVEWTTLGGEPWWSIVETIAGVSESEIVIGGFFDQIGEVVSLNFARWGCPLAPCYADCDRSASLDFFDFLCFQNLFAAHDPGADCDESGALDFFDFLCFQNAFAAGCP